MRATKLLAIALIATLSGCNGNNGENCFCDNHETIAQPPNGTTLHGKLVISQEELLGVGDLNCFKDYLIIDYARNKDSIFTVYTNRGEKVAQFGKSGRAANEFTVGLSLNGQHSDRCVYANDVNQSMLKAIDIISSIDSGKCVIEWKIPTGGRVMDAFMLNDSIMLYSQETADNFRLNFMNVKSRKKINGIDLFAPHKNAFSIYSQNICINVSKNCIAMGMNSINQINFMTLDNKYRRSVSIYENADADFDKADEMQYYCKLNGNKEFVYALYMNQPYEDSFAKPKEMEIHVFNWNGKLERILNVKEYLLTIAVDEDNEFLYGRDNNNNIFKYEL